MILKNDSLFQIVKIIRVRKNHFSAKSLVSYAGERFDVIVVANQPVGNYWIRIKGLIDCGPKFTKAFQVAVLRYDGAPEEDPSGEVGYNFPAQEELTLVLTYTCIA